MTTSALVKASIPVLVLVGLTKGAPVLNAQSSDIDDTVLDAAAAQAEGVFQNITGTDPDSDNTLHRAALVTGTRWALEMAKGNTYKVVADWYKAFADLCTSVVSRVVINPQTSSTLKPTKEIANSKPDFDRGGFIKGLTEQPIFRGNSPSETDVDA